MDTFIKLIDTDKSFIVVTENIEAKMEYGAMALAIANTKFDDMHALIKNFITQNRILKTAEQLQSSYYLSHTLEKSFIDIIFQDLYPLMSELLTYSGLESMQSKIVTRLIFQEVKNNFLNEDIDLSEPNNYIPAVFAYKELHQHVKDSLLKKESVFTSELQEEINQIGISTAIRISEDGTPLTVFYLQDIFSYLIVDIQKYILSKKYVNECECCHRFFYPLYRSTERYCRFPNKDKGKTCNLIMQHSKDDDYAKLARRARGYQHNRCTNESTVKKYKQQFLTDLYKDWSTDCSKQQRYFKIQDDYKGFEKWVSETRFTAEQLKKKYEEYSNI